MKKIDNIRDFMLLNIKDIKGLCNLIGVQYEYIKGNDLETKKMTLYRIINCSYKESAISFLNNKTIGISYSSVNKSVMLSICESLKRNNYNIYTDLTNIYDSNMLTTEFEQKLAQQDILLVLVCTNYFKSEHCMYELFYNYFNCLLNKKHLIKYTIPLCIKGTDLKDDTVKKLIESWKKKNDELSKYYNELHNVSRSSLGEKINQIDEICYHFANIVNTLKDINMIIVDPDNVQECIPQLLKRIENITSQWE